MIRAAVISILASGALGVLGTLGVRGWEDLERQRLQQSIDRHTLALSHALGLLRQQDEIDRQFRASRAFSGRSARTKIIEVVDSYHDLSIRRVELANQGRRASLDIAGPYAGLLRTLVVLPARIDGLTLQHATFTAAADVHDGAIAHIEGTFR
jgi:hypothetical protein